MSNAFRGLRHSIPTEESRLPVLVLPLKAEYFDAIRDGTKPEEFRLVNDYWTKRLIGAGGAHRSFDHIVLTKGYPKRNDASRRLVRQWRGFVRLTLTHPHFGPEPVKVFAIDVSQQAAPVEREQPGTQASLEAGVNPLPHPSSPQGEQT